jgi:hypothetical protein
LLSKKRDADENKDGDLDSVSEGFDSHRKKGTGK